MTGTWAAVPVKGFASAKQRLARVFAPGERQALATAMLEDVLAVLATARLAGILVNTADRKSAALARRYSARVITIDARDSHTAAVAAMARVLAKDRAEAMLTVPGDIPRVTPAEMSTLLEARQPAPSFTIVPSRDWRGSNAVLLAPPDVVPLTFGDNSYFPHIETARLHNLEPVTVLLPGIALDLDHPEDVRAFLAADPPMATRTFTLLRELTASRETNANATVRDRGNRR
jgi:2-phospho-L-lactate/phosphoenolpyruvate guanylyltransferase